MKTVKKGKGERRIESSSIKTSAGSVVLHPPGVATELRAIGRTEDELRDWYAGIAMSGMMVDRHIHNATKEEFSVVAYNLADAMLAERSKRGPVNPPV